MMVAALARLAQVNDINELANFQFNAKTEALRDMSETEIFLGDHKVFEYKPKGKKSFLVGFGVVECVGDAHGVTAVSDRGGDREEIACVPLSTAPPFFWVLA